MFEQRFKIFLILFVSVEHAISFQVFKLNTGPYRKDLAKQLKDILHEDANKSTPKYSKNKLYFHDKPNFRRAFSNDLSKNSFGNSRLVSRIIPHGYRSGKYEYDSKLNTIYKPLIRFHVKKPVKKIEELLDNSNEKTKVIGYAVIIRKNDNLFKKKKNKKSKLISFQIVDLENMMRSGKEIAEALMDKSGEQLDELAPGSIPISHDSMEVITVPPTVIAAYPFWNYWTYAKTIHQDDCEGQLVKLGNVCIFPSGHRRKMVP
ncbi:unnamed protein product [Arctia plantaginis]|uniref:Uncharacterized protein n=1 Tax=Arctia plantaginis TaxID=874455 RepID=A0A8S0ZA20_ARCPL|nr:unnamed protein product [Arctia plantaginis]